MPNKENREHYIFFNYKEHHTEEINVLADLIKDFHKEN
jgi:hypothetical protein